MSLSPFPRRSRIVGDSGYISKEWDEWALNLYATVKSLETSVASLSTSVAAFQAALTDVPFDASAFTGGALGAVGAGTMSVSVQARHVLANRARKIGAQLWWSLALYSGTDAVIGGTTQQSVRIRLPLGATGISSAVQRIPLSRVGDASGYDPGAFGTIQPEEPGVLQVLKESGGAWTAGTLDLQFFVMLEVQP